MAAPKAYKIATLGSHSALQILKGAHDEGFSTICVVTPNRVSLYSRFKFIDKFIHIPQFSDFPKIQNQLIKENAILIPHGSFVAYLGLDENKKMKVAYFGNKKVLDWESDRLKQRQWLQMADVPVPKRFKKGDKINRPVIVKSYGAAGGHGYFFAKNQKEFDARIKFFLIFGKEVTMASSSTK